MRRRCVFYDHAPRRMRLACCVLASTVVNVHPRILVADDDPAMLRVVTEVLEHLGATVIQARSGADLIEAIGDRGPFDLVVTDVSMPWMSGLQAMHSARTAGLATPVIVMTAIPAGQVESQVSTLGDDAILLRKPFAMRDLESATATLLASH